MCAMDSVLITPPQIIKMNAVHFKVMRSIFGFKSSYYHRVVAPTNAPCSNEFLADTSFRAGRVITPSQLYSQCRLQLLGHLMRHPESLEYQARFMNSGAYRFTRGSNRTGRPKVHWAESSSQRLQPDWNISSQMRPRPMETSITPFTKFLPRSSSYLSWFTRNCLDG